MSKPISTESDAATPAMLEDNLLPFNFPAVERKKVTAAFDGGRITSDGGVMLLAAVEKRTRHRRPARAVDHRSAQSAAGDAQRGRHPARAHAGHCLRL